MTDRLGGIFDNILAGLVLAGVLAAFPLLWGRVKKMFSAILWKDELDCSAHAGDYRYPDHSDDRDIPHLGYVSRLRPCWKRALDFLVRLRKKVIRWLPRHR